MSVTEAPGRRGCPGWMKLLLIVSLAANLAVAGLVIGHAFRPNEERGGGRGPDRTIGWIVEMMPEERREFALNHFAGAREEIAAARANRGALLAAVVAAIRAEPFDPAGLDAALDALFDRRATGRSVVRERMVTLLAQLTPAERDAFAARFAARMDDSGGRRE